VCLEEVEHLRKIRFAQIFDLAHSIISKSEYDNKSSTLPDTYHKEEESSIEFR
jgi:hypothetical protein